MTRVVICVISDWVRYSSFSLSSPSCKPSPFFCDSGEAGEITTIGVGGGDVAAVEPESALEFELEADPSLPVESDLAFIVEQGEGGTTLLSFEEKEYVDIGLVINFGFEMALLRIVRRLWELWTWECMQPILYRFFLSRM